MDANMSEKTKKEVMLKLRSRYERAGREHRRKWCQKGRTDPIYYTRSRPYRSNDNAHIEQKNWTHVRHWFGYERHDNAAVAPLINELAQNCGSF